MAVKKRRQVTDNGNKDEYMRRIMNNLYKYAKKNNLTYVSATIIDDYVGIRAKSGDKVFSDEHCFKETRDGNQNKSTLGW